MIPLSSSFGPQSALLSGATALIPLPVVAGVHRFTAGWDGGPGATVDVVGVSCVVACQPWQACRATSDGGVCDSLNLTLAFVTPDSGLTFNTASVPARLSVTRATGAIPASLTSIPLFGQTANNTAGAGPLTPLSGGGNTFTGALPLFLPEGPKTFVAGWPDGGPFASLSLVRDTTPPDVLVVVLPRPSSAPDPHPSDPGRWKKFERALVQVFVDGGRPAVATDLLVLDSGVAVGSVSATTCGCTDCGCFEVPLQSAPDDSDAVAIRLSPIADAVGNLSAAVNTIIPTTRFLWRRSVPGAQFLSIAENGVVVLQSSSGLQTVYPDAGLGWTWVASGGRQLAQQPPAISQGSVYVLETESIGDTNGVRRLALATGADLGSFCYGTRAGLPVMTLATTSAGVEVPVFTAKPDIILATAGCPSASLAPNQLVTLVAQREPTGELAIYGGGPSELRKFVFDGVAWADGGVRQGNVTSLFMTPGAVGSLSASALSATLAASSDVTAVSVQSVTSVVPLVAGASSVFGAATQRLGRSDYTGAMLGPWDDTPVLGSGAPTILILGAGAFYGNFRFEPTRVLADGSRRPYSALTDGAQTFAIDVLRTASGSKVCGLGFGVSYGLDPTGALTATLIDSEGLDRTAPWPAPLHDSANSGNADRSLAPWSCP
jgi:hypothetical protein